MEPKLSKYLAGFRRNHNTQHALLKMIESWRALLNISQKVGAIIMDLSKAFDTLNHKLLFKKLQAYGFYKKSFSFIENYFTNRKQRTKIGDSFSKYKRIITGVPQGSILGHLFSISSLMIYILLLTNQPYVTTLMIIHFTLRVIMQTLSLIS